MFIDKNLRTVDSKRAINCRTIFQDDDLLWGHVIRNGPVHFPEEGMMREFVPFDKWIYVPRYLFNQSVYPTYLLGDSYVMPFRVLECLYRKTLSMPYFHVNDAFVTGMAREMCHYGLKSDETYLKKAQSLSWSVRAIMSRHATLEFYQIHEVMKQRNREVLKAVYDQNLL